MRSNPKPTVEQIVQKNFITPKLAPQIASRNLNKVRGSVKKFIDPNSNFAKDLVERYAFFKADFSINNQEEFAKAASDIKEQMIFALADFTKELLNIDDKEAFCAIYSGLDDQEKKDFVARISPAKEIIKNLRLREFGKNNKVSLLLWEAISYYEEKVADLKLLREKEDGGICRYTLNEDGEEGEEAEWFGRYEVLEERLKKLYDFEEDSWLENQPIEELERFLDDALKYRNGLKGGHNFFFNDDPIILSCLEAPQDDNESFKTDPLIKCILDKYLIELEEYFISRHKEDKNGKASECFFALIDNRLNNLDDHNINSRQFSNEEIEDDLRVLNQASKLLSCLSEMDLTKASSHLLLSNLDYNLRKIIELDKNIRTNSQECPTQLTDAAEKLINQISNNASPELKKGTSQI